MMVNISFLVPGFSKCGTTTLCALLARHPDIFIPANKEPSFFSADDFEQSWSFYQSLFEAVKDETAIGEGSTFYSRYDREVISRERILQHYPDVKLIFIARHPFARIESSFREFHHSGPKYGLDAPFELEDALQALPALLEDTRYWIRISNYRDYMPQDRIHVVFLEDLVESPRRELKRCFQFLGVDPEIELPDDQLRLNSGAQKLRDSRLLRALRNNRHTGFKLARIPVATQDRWFRVLGLRRPFLGPIHWAPDLRQQVQQHLCDEVRQFLEFAGKPADFWAGF